MRFTLMVGIGGYQEYVAIAQAAEASGWTSLSMPDSIFFPRETNSDYPYADTAAIRQYIEASPFIDPIVTMSVLVAVTKKLRFYPGVLKVPVRQPLILAKTLSSLAVLSNNRITLGAGISPWREDFIYNGVAWEPRGKLLDECLEILRGAMSGQYFEYHSEYYDFGPMKMSPAPTRPVPIIVGGHAKVALARAAKHDGWISANTDFETLRTLIGQLNELRAQQGTLQRADYEIHAYDMNAQTLDDFRRLRDIGVTDICATPWNVYQPTLSLQDKLDNLRRFGDEIIAKY